MEGRSRAALFLVEKLIVIAVFALCAAACVDIFANAFLTASSAKDLSNALTTAKNGAERYKANESITETARALGGTANNAEGTSAAVYYDKDWQISSESEAAYILHMTHISSNTPPQLCHIAVTKVSGEEIVSFTVAARGANDQS